MSMVDTWGDTKWVAKWLISIFRLKYYIRMMLKTKNVMVGFHFIRLCLFKFNEPLNTKTF